MREFLSHRRVPFVERNIRWNPDAQQELRQLTGQLVVPTLVVGDEWFLGYDPELLQTLVARSETEWDAMQRPPRDAASVSQGPMAARRHDQLAATLVDLLGRIEEELAYNAAKGSGLYRQGMHDGLRFAQDALVAVLAEHGVDAGPTAPSTQTTALDA